MKQIIKISAIITLCVALFTVYGCEKLGGVKLPFCGGSACKTPLSPSMANCLRSSFLGGLEESLSHYAPLYVVKGIALDTYNNYGRRIKLIEDLIGNLPENTDTLIVWGNTGMWGGNIETHGNTVHPLDSNDSDVYYGRMERLACYDCYKKGDILIMKLQRPQKVFGDRDWQAPSEYFTTYGSCVYSVLWLRNGYELGLVSGNWDREPVDWVFRNAVYRMSWRDFQRELNNVLKIN